jgi:CBS domain-containing membrane protein
MKLNVPISTIMSKNTIKLNSDDTLTKAERLFKEHKIRHIPVIKDDKIIGMLSYTDLLRVSYVDAVDDDADKIEAIVYDMFTIEQVMTKEVVTISPNSTIRAAAKILAKNEFHALPICQEGFFVGIVTTTDLIKYLLEQYNKEI